MVRQVPAWSRNGTQIDRTLIDMGRDETGVDREGPAGAAIGITMDRIVVGVDQLESKLESKWIGMASISIKKGPAWIDNGADIDRTCIDADRD